MTDVATCRKCKNSKDLGNADHFCAVTCTDRGESSRYDQRAPRIHEAEARCARAASGLDVFFTRHANAASNPLPAGRLGDAVINSGAIMIKPRPAFSMVEILIVIAVLGILSAVALPSMTRGRAQAELSSATNRFSRTVGVARQAAIMRGRRSYFKAEAGMVWVVVDTGGGPADSVVVVPAFGLDSTYNLTAITPGELAVIEFDPRGVSTQPSQKVFHFVHALGLQDSLCVSKLGNSIRTVCP